ncbi:hypothetical protein PPM_p0234 (plasmid) [Paenibacillus polymyxa M1]|nr:hypothetical protein PPM_p0234 [Paenibacillus polymyxa M1]
MKGETLMQEKPNSLPCDIKVLENAEQLLETLKAQGKEVIHLEYNDLSQSGWFNPFTGESGSFTKKA